MTYSQALGIWRGTSSESEKEFSHFTEIRIFQENGVTLGVRNDRQSMQNDAFEIIWTAPTEFQSKIKHWCIPAYVSAKGEFSCDYSKLTLNLEGEGMTGVASISIELDRHFDKYEKYYKSLKNFNYRYLPPVSKVYETSDASQQGISNNVLEEYVNDLIHLNSDPYSPLQPRVDAVSIVKNGKLVLEEYFYGMKANKQHMISSCTKSITSILICIAIEQKKADLEDNLAQVFGIEGSWKEKPPVLLKHLLSMTSGSKFEPEKSMDLLLTEDILSFVFGCEKIHDAGSVYNYDNSLPALAGCYLELVTKMSIEDFAKQYLFDKLDISNYLWNYMKQKSIDGNNLPLTSGGFYMTLNDLTKIGVMMLQGGVFNGNRILSEEMVKVSTSQFTPDGEYPYGLYWHLHKNDRHYRGFGGYSALGQGEQILSIFPEKNLVVTMLSSSWDSNVAVTISAKDTLNKYINEL